jgi:hypothetical protein
MNCVDMHGRARKCCARRRPAPRAGSGSIVLTPLIATFDAGLTAPMFPGMKLSIGAMTAAQIWSRYVRYIGASAVAAAGTRRGGRGERPVLLRVLRVSA